jgi:DtxR family Mn-dependent transcriptional regulator
MVDPALALTTFGILVLLGLLLFWPRRGLVSRLRTLLGASERIRLEDALKHLYKCEYAGRSSSVDSVAGAVGVSKTGALNLLGRLEETNLAVASGEGFHLTDEGREYALHIVRTHRLLERYLADRTGVAAVEWHQEAERREHAFSREETATLSARLGHPRYDPHGDPIPTARGELPPLTGLPLTALEPGDVASVVHLGDEPREVFLALSEAGLSPHMLLRVLAVEPEGIRFESEDREHLLSPVVARNLTVEPLPGAVVGEGERERETLAQVGPGQAARVVGIHPTLQGPQRRRLLDLGLVPGTEVWAELESAGGDPTAYRVRGALIALREDQARWILVDRVASEGAG